MPPSRRILSFAALFAALVLMTLPAGAAMAQDQAQPQPQVELADAEASFETKAQAWQRALDNVERRIGDGLPRDGAEIAALRETLLAVREQAETEIAAQSGKIADTQALIDSLGPEPGENDPEEPASVARERRELNQRLAELRAQEAGAELAVTRSRELDGDIAEARRSRLMERLTRVSPVPVAPDTMAVAVPGFGNYIASLAALPTAWWTGLEHQPGMDELLPYLIAALLALLVGYFLRRVLLMRLGPRRDIEEPTYARRLVAAFAVAAATGIIPALLVGAIYWLLQIEDAIVTGSFAALLGLLCIVTILGLLISAIAHAALSPRYPDWRVTPLIGAGADRLALAVDVVVVAGALEILFRLTTQGADAVAEVAPETRALVLFVLIAIQAIFVLIALQRRNWHMAVAAPDEDDEDDDVASGADAGEPATRFGFWPGIRLAAIAAAAAGLAAGTVGYLGLQNYLTNGVLFTALLIGGVFLARGLLREAIGAALRSEAIRERFGMSHRSRSVAKFWLRALLDVVVVVGTVLLILPVWGLPWSDVGRLLDRAASGFTIGGATISPTDILIAVVLFVVVMLVTRTAQRVVGTKVLPRTHLDSGIQNSLTAGLGYVGALIAGIFAISAAGIDLSNIALIAGALSVGIGFGLQNIVNNFVSGLIMLAERPVKVGDWVVVGAFEGVVKRISVRATEIQTFSRASVIVPNSEFLQQAVTNWTHKDLYGRVEAPVGVAYGSDTKKVHELLMEAAHEHDRVLAFPEPFALFLEFGDSSLNFQLYCYIGDVNYRFRVRSELNFAIDAKFREHGIEIPFPQRVIHMAPGSEAPKPVAPEDGEEAMADGQSQPADEGGPAGKADDA